MGAGVAGLQAIGTAKRLGAQVQLHAVDDGVGCVHQPADRKAFIGLVDDEDLEILVVVVEARQVEHEAVFEPQRAQTQLVATFLGVAVLFPGYGVTAPADDDIQIGGCEQ